MSNSNEVSFYKEIDNKNMKFKSVAMSNELVQAKKDILSVNQRRIMYLIFSCFNYEKDKTTAPTFFRFTANDIIKIAELSDKNHKRLREDIENLVFKEIHITDNKGKELVGCWVSRVEYFKNTGIIDITISLKIIPYLVEFSKGFTKMNLQTLMKFNNKNAMILYEIINRWRRVGISKVSIEELKKLMHISDKAKISDIKATINSAIKEVKDKTETNVTMEEIKKGKNITGFVFRFPKLITEQEREKYEMKKKEKMARKKSFFVENNKEKVFDNDDLTYDDDGNLISI